MFDVIIIIHKNFKSIFSFIQILFYSNSIFKCNSIYITKLNKSSNGKFVMFSYTPKNSFLFLLFICVKNLTRI